jgi:hypothetical protein
LFWAKTLGDTDFGVQLSYADNKDNETGGYETPRFTPAYTEEVTDYARQYEFKVGVGMKGMGPFQEANFAVAYKLGKIGYSDQVSDPITGNYKIEDDGIHSFALNADLRHDMDENNNIKLFAGVRLNQVGMKGVSQVSPTQVFSSTVKTKYTNFVVGLGCNHKVAEGKGLVSAGLKLDVKAIKYEADVIDQNGEEYFAAQKAVTVDALMEDKNNTLVLPVFMSVEAKVKNWLTLRAGSEYHLYSKTHESGVYTFGPGDYYYTPESRFVLTTGFGLTWKNWALDGYLNTDMLERLAAKHDDGSPLASLDMRYKF